MTDYNDLWSLHRPDYVNLVTELRADLAEARADVQRFEAALDASQRELAEAERKLAVSETLRAAASRSGNEVAKSTLDYYAMEKRKARTWEERALKAEAALDVSQRELAEARKQRDFAKDGEDNMRFLKVLWENECGFYRAQSVARLHEIDISRRTIRALVVAARAGVQSVYSIAQGSWGTKEACINLLRAHVASADALYHYKRGSADGQVMHD